MLIGPWLIHMAKRRVRSTTLGEKGDAVYGPIVTFSCRCEKTNKLVRTSDGKNIHAAWVLATTTPINPDDKVWLPSIAGELADDSTTGGLQPISVVVATNKTGTQSLWQCYF